MGCWHKTCGLSNLHIPVGSEVYVFVLEENTNRTDRNYATSFWQPLLLPFTAVYDDYGGGENSSSILQYIIDGLKPKLVEKELGSNQCHDIEVKADKFDEELFFESIYERRLFTRDYYGEEARCEFVMFRKDIVDYILDSLDIERYVGNGLGTSGYDSSYVKCKFADVLADIPAFIDELKRISQPDEEGDDILSRVKLLGRRLENVFELKHANKAAWYTRKDLYRYSSILRIDQLVFDLVDAGEYSEAEAVFTEYVRASFLDEYMDSIRKCWAPGCFEGSQSREVDAYRVQVAAITAALDKEQADCDDE